MALPFGCGCLGTTVAEAVNIPGDDGANGVAGVNGYSTLTDPLVLPAIGVNVTATMGSTAWIAYGQFLVVGSTTLGYAHFQVQLLPAKTATTVTLKFLGYPGDALPTVNLPTGSIVSPAGPWGLPAPLTVYAATGTGHTIANATGIVTIGATAITLVITTPGTYIFSARARVDYWGATFAEVQLVTLKLRRTNNTAADVPNATAGLKTAIVTLVAHTAGIVQLPTVSYTTALATDSISLQAVVDVLPSAGEVRVLQAEIVALRIY
jgi:hypothetical protein